jgi:hypothetical protein
MKIGVLHGKLNQWQAGIAWGKAPEWQQRFLHRQFWFIHAWCLKLISHPKPNEMIQPEHFKGIRFYKEFLIT